MLMTSPDRAHPARGLMGAQRRGLAWIAMLVAACLALSAGLACAMPFAALAAVAALSLPRRRAWAATGAAWFANQAVGFAVLGYPWTAECIAWGAALGAIALLATVAAQGSIRRTASRGAPVVVCATFLCAFAAYEGGCFAVSATLLGGADLYTGPVVTQILLTNLVAFAALLLLAAIAYGRLGGTAGMRGKPGRSSGFSRNTAG